MTSTYEQGDLSIELRGPHRPRAVRYLGVEPVAGWRMKVYAITMGDDPVRPALTEAALAAAAITLPAPAVTAARYGIGFMIVHDAAEHCFALIDWWSGENELHQRTFACPRTDSVALAPYDGLGVGCVWELEVTDFERRAWLRDVLANPTGPDLGLYLGRSFEGSL